MRGLWRHRPLLKRRERQELNEVFWGMVRAWEGRGPVTLADRIVHARIIEEYADAVDWLEELRR